MIRAAILIGLFVLNACVPAPPRPIIGPACQTGERGCLGAYQPREFDDQAAERSAADRALCRAAPP